LADFVAAGSVGVGSVAWAANVGRADLPVRAAVVAGSAAELVAGLRGVAAGAGVRGRKVGGVSPSVALLAPGLGSEVAGVFAGLYGRVPVITGVLDGLGSVAELPLRVLVDGGSASRAALARPEVAQPALYAMAVALGVWWESVGVSADVVVGDGVGACAAAALAGVINHTDGYRVVTIRGALAAGLIGEAAAVEAVGSVLLYPASRPLLTDLAGVRELPAISDLTAWVTQPAERPAVDPLPALVDRGVGIVIELGPGAGGVPAIADRQQGDRPVVVASVGPAGSERRLWEALAEVWVAGVEVGWAAVAARPLSLPRLPTYPFQRQTYWHPSLGQRRPTVADLAAATGVALNPAVVETADSGVVGQTNLSLAVLPFLAEHRVHGALVVPGVVFLELVLRTAETLADEVSLQELSITRPLVLADDQSRTVQVIIDPIVSGRAGVRVRSKDPVAGWRQHLAATLLVGEAAADGVAEPLPAVDQLPPDGTRSFDQAEFYGAAWHGSFVLGDSFRLVTRAELGESVAVGNLRPPGDASAGVAAGVRPDLLLLDACVQLVRVAAGSADESPDAPVQLGTGYSRLTVHQPDINGPVRCVAVIRPTSDGTLLGDVGLIDGEGRPVADMYGVSFRSVSQGMLKSVLAVDGATVPAAPGAPAIDLAVLRSAAPDARGRLVLEHLIGLLGGVLGSGKDDVDVHSPVTDLVDSLMLVELQSRVERDFGLSVPLAALFDAGSLTGLAGWLGAELDEPQPWAAPTEPAAAPGSPVVGAAPAAQLQPAAPTEAAAIGEPSLIKMRAAPSASAPAAAPTARRTGSRIRSMTVEQMTELAILDPSIRPGAPAEPLGQAPRAVLLTGGTGFVGAFLLAELLGRPIGEVYCLVRAEDEAHAMRRILDNLDSYGIDIDAAGRSRIRPVVGDLGQSKLGLSESDFADLHARVGHIFHNGATVKWTYPYSGLAEANVGGTREVLRLATFGAARPVHFTSTVGVFSSRDDDRDVVREDDELSSSGPLVVGYAQSKWVAEKMVRNAGERGLPITIHRINSGGDSRSGAFNRADHLCMLIKGCIEAGIAPLDARMPLQPAPVDYIARAIVELSFQDDFRGRTSHLVNHQPMSWVELFDHIERFGYEIHRLEFPDWKDRVTGRRSGTLALLGLVPFLNDTVDHVRLAVSDSSATRAALRGSGVSCPPLSGDLISTYLERFVSKGFVRPPVDAVDYSTQREDVA
jgi:thioester reductase-like protein